jgi:MinD superfamily P-loop ATPase
MVNRDSGFSYISETRFGPMAHAMLKTAEEASGKLVTVVRNNAKTLAEEKKKDLIIIDGPPGIGCPVIASISGVDLVLIVTEPTLSAIHDLKRILGVADHFKIPAVVCINKCDINLENTEKIEHYCKTNNIDIVGQLPYDNVVTKAMIHEKTVVEYSNGNFSDTLSEMWNNVKGRLEE